MLSIIKKLYSDKNPANALRALAGFFVLLIISVSIFYQSIYYAKNELEQYIPDTAVLAVQIKEPLWLQQKHSFKNDFFNPLYLIIDKSFEPRLTFKKDILPLTGRQYVYVLYRTQTGKQQEGSATSTGLTSNDKISAAVIIKVKAIETIDSAFAEPYYARLSHDIFAICSAPCQKEEFQLSAGRSVFNVGSPSYHFVQLYADINAVDLVEKFLVSHFAFKPGDDNISGILKPYTNFVHSDFITVSKAAKRSAYLALDQFGKDWRYSIKLSAGNCRQNLYRPADSFTDSNSFLIPGANYMMYARNLNDQIFFPSIWRYFLSATSTPQIDYMPLTSPFAGSLDLAVYQNNKQDVNFIIAGPLKQNFNAQSFAGFIQGSLAAVFPSAREVVLPDLSTSTEIIADPGQFAFQPSGKTEYAYHQGNSAYEIFYHLKDDYVFLANSGQLLKEQLNISNRSLGFIKQMKNCWGGIPESLMAVDGSLLDYRFSNNISFAVGKALGRFAADGSIDGCLISL